MPDSVFERFSAVDGGLRVELLVQPAINYALVHPGATGARSVHTTTPTAGPRLWRSARP